MGCCGQKNNAQYEYEVKLNNGTVKRVGSMGDVRVALATGGGGTYRSVPVKAAT